MNRDHVWTRQSSRLVTSGEGCSLEFGVIEEPADCLVLPSIDCSMQPARFAERIAKPEVPN